MTPDAQMYERIKAMVEDANSTDANTKVEAIHGLIRDARKIAAFAIEQYEAREKLETALRDIVAIESGRMYGSCPDCDTPDACRENGCVVKSRAQMRAEGALPPAPTAATPDMGQEG